jgi:hypothetical protein
MALARVGHSDLAWHELAALARVNALDDWRFTEWFHGSTLEPMGMAGQLAPPSKTNTHASRAVFGAP